MKKGYIRLLIFNFSIFVILLLNSFVSNILSNYNIIIFLLTLLVIFKLVFGFENKKHRYVKNIIIDIIIYLIIFFLLYYLFGVLIGFVTTNNYLTVYGVKEFILPIILFTILKEFLRYNVLTKSEGHKLVIIISVIIFILLDITNSIYYSHFNSSYLVFKFFALELLPAISVNILCSFLTTKVGYIPSIIYLLITGLYMYIFPIVPNVNEYIMSLIKLLLPIILWFRIRYLFEKEDDQQVKREYNKKSIIPYTFSIIFIIIIVYFTSGYFKYYSVAIASGSMEPVITKGDVVVIEMIKDNDYDQIKKGDIIAYKYDSTIIVHRVTRIIKDKNEYFFYTKGDFNKEEDSYAIKKEMILGKIKYKIKYIGLPTVWLNA